MKSLQNPPISNGHEVSDDTKLGTIPEVQPERPHRSREPHKPSEDTLQVPSDGMHNISRRSSRKSRSSQHNNEEPKSSKSIKKKLDWVINCITDAIEQTIECEPITLKIQKSQLSQLANKTTAGSDLKPVITGNWGSGRSKRADPQLKLVVQWLAGSVAGVPSMIYYTSGNSQLFKMDTLSRVLVDRKWTVGQLATAALRFAEQTLHEPHAIPDGNTLFDELIGIEKFSEESD